MFLIKAALPDPDDAELMVVSDRRAPRSQPLCHPSILYAAEGSIWLRDAFVTMNKLGPTPSNHTFRKFLDQLPSHLLNVASHNGNCRVLDSRFLISSLTEGGILYQLRETIASAVVASVCAAEPARVQNLPTSPARAGELIIRELVASRRSFCDSWDYESSLAEVQRWIRAARHVIETLTQSLALSYEICGTALAFTNRPSLLHIIRKAHNIRCVAAAIISIHIKASASNLQSGMPSRQILSTFSGLDR